jgi:hypothetical protein
MKSRDHDRQPVDPSRLERGWLMWLAWMPRPRPRDDVADQPDEQP